MRRSPCLALAVILPAVLPGCSVNVRPTKGQKAPNIVEHAADAQPAQGDSEAARQESGKPTTGGPEPDAANDAAAPAATTPGDESSRRGDDEAARSLAEQPSPPTTGDVAPTVPPEPVIARLTAQFVPRSPGGGIVYGKVRHESLPAGLVATVYLVTDRAYLQSDCLADVADGTFTVPVTPGRAWHSMIVLVVRREYMAQLAPMTEPAAAGYLPDGFRIVGRTVVAR